MTRLLIVSLTTIALLLLTGCDFMFVSQEETVVEEEVPPHIDSYIYIPDNIKYLIAEHVNFYSMPPISRYNYTLYPEHASYDPDNLPSYVKADFNGDGFGDYAYMFSKVYYSGGYWYLKTKMLIIASTNYSYEIADELDLGTISAPESTPVEEYWSIRLLKQGTHKVTMYQNGVEKEVTVELKNDGIYLGSIDPKERSVFWVDRTQAHEIAVNLGSIAKRKASAKDPRSERIIKL